MPEITPLREEFETEAEEDARLRELMDLAGDDDVPADERMRAIWEADAILVQRQPLEFQFPPGWTRVQRWLAAFHQAHHLWLIERKVPGRRAVATTRKLVAEFHADLDAEERAVIQQKLEPYFKLLPLLQAVAERSLAGPATPTAAPDVEPPGKRVAAQRGASTAALYLSIRPKLSASAAMRQLAIRPETVNAGRIAVAGKASSDTGSGRMDG